MPLSGEHDQPLRLECGEDGVLDLAGQVMAASALVMIAAGGFAPELKLFLAVLTLAILRLPLGLIPAGTRLSLRPDGSTDCAGQVGHMRSSAWVSSRYIVVCLQDENRRRSVMISASRQDPGEYRKLLSWLRLGRWHDEG
jgi:hypothetical protein